jgi:hypothetical protein
VVRAERLYEILRPLDGHIMIQPPSMTLGPAAYYLGILAAIMERWDDAIGHSGDLLRACDP